MCCRLSSIWPVVRCKKQTKIDGVDMTPILLGETDKSSRENWFYYKGTKLEAVRSGPWKLAVEPQTMGMGFRNPPEDLQVKNARLYNLKEDLGESTNVAAQHPDVVTRLQGLIDEMSGDIGSGKPGPRSPPGRGGGQSCDSVSNASPAEESSQEDSAESPSQMTESLSRVRNDSSNRNKQFARQEMKPMRYPILAAALAALTLTSVARSARPAQRRLDRF